LMDFDTQEKVNDDETQREIFGLLWVGAVQGTANMIFSKPSSATNLTYLPYKFFYHIPLPINYSSSEFIPGCAYQPSANGSLVLNKMNYAFWICDSTRVWFDTNADGSPDTLTQLGKNFTLAGFNFTLNYIHDNTTIAVSFKPNYMFSDYFSYQQGGIKYIAKIIPEDGKIGRIFLKAIKDGEEFPTVILNSSRVAWMYDFDENPSDDEKELLLSLLLWASRKRSVVLTSPVKKGFSTSYVNVQNVDIFEVYKFDLGLGYPY
jgi:hypothetical protein